MHSLSMFWKQSNSLIKGGASISGLGENPLTAWGGGSCDLAAQLAIDIARTSPRVPLSPFNWEPVTGTGRTGASQGGTLALVKASSLGTIPVKVLTQEAER